MFLHLSVSHSVHRGVRAWQEGHVWQGGDAWQGCMCGRGHAWQGVGGMCGRGVCMVGGMCGGVCVCVWQGACMAGGVHATHAPPTLRDMVGQCAGDTHLTGMHSCFIMKARTKKKYLHFLVKMK